MTPSPGQLRSLAGTIATEAGDFAAAGRRAGVGPAESKSSATDLVTRWDRAAETLIVDRILGAFPGDGIVGEEGGGRASGSGRTWWIDPIDGTTNFVYDLPGWAVSIAVSDDDGALAGAVYIPATAELFAAERGGGATLNGVPLRHSNCDDLAHALVATGFSYDRHRRVEQGRRIAAILPQVRDIRRLGAAAVDLCHAAAGRVDIYFEEGLGPWDYAAGSLIAVEAGCVVTDLRGGPFGVHGIVACPPRLHDATIELLARADGG
jgi:myo-inositol-1(or 4)-monophosphatase